MRKDYYKILGVSEKASPDEIRRAFRRLAQQYHPDKGGDAEKFKELNEAYQVLSEPEKRRQYDQFGSTFDGMNGQGFNWQDFGRGFGGQGFGQAGGGFDYQDLGDIVGDLFGFGRRASREDSGRGRDLEVEMAIDFRDAVFGVEHSLQINKSIPCERCGGKGGEPGSKLVTCSTCRGAGQVRYNQSILFGTIQTYRTCPTCAGARDVPEKPCNECDGKGSVNGTKKLKIRIPAGIDDGESVRLAGQGEAGRRGASSGDLYMRVSVRPDKEFRREGVNILTRQEITFPLAALGGILPVKTVDGEVSLKIPPATQSGQIFKLKSRGVPSVKGQTRGDHLVEIIVKVPERLSSQEKELIRRLGEQMGVKF